MSAEFLNYPRALALLWTLGRVFRRQSEKPHLVVASPPNNGLTTILLKFTEEEGARIPASEEVTPHPVIYSPAPSEIVDEERLLNMILLSINAPIATHKRDAGPLRRSAVTILKTIGTRMIILDHAAHLFPENPKERQAALTTVLEVADATDTRIVIAGLTKPPLVDAAGPFAVATLKGWAADAEFDAVVAVFCTALDLRVPTARRTAIIGALHAATSGRLGELAALLRLYAKEQGLIVSEAGLADLDWTAPGTPPTLPPL